MEGYLTHEDVLYELESKFKSIQWNEEDILRWCQQVETIYISDPDSMWKYREIHIEVTRGKFILPVNLYKLEDVYDPETEQRVDYNRRGNVIKQLIGFKGDVIAINYIGCPIDKNCMPLIDENHLPACETFCKINSFEELALYNEINASVFADWKQRFDGMIQSVKGDFKNWDSKAFAEMTIIMGNEIPKIGFQPLSHKYFG